MSKYPQANPEALRCEPLKAAWAGSLTRPGYVGQVIGGRSLPHFQLLQALIFLFLVADVLPNHCIVSAYG